MKEFKKLNIGTFDTPKHLAKFFIKEFGILEQWINGNSVFDPTMGEGNLIVSLIELALENGHSINDLPLHSLYGNEINTNKYKKAKENLLLCLDEIKDKNKINKIINDNFTNEDIFDLQLNKKFNIIFGNPPFINFNDIEDKEYKKHIKEHFINLGIVKNKKDVLLGNSRVDIAPAIILKCIRDFTEEYGNLYFFIPMSIFLNDGANKNFRKYNIDGIDYKINKIYDLNLKLKDKKLLFNVNTRYGFVHISKNKKTKFPIEYRILIKRQLTKDSFEIKKAMPVMEKDDFLSIFEFSDNIISLDKFSINKENKPRQGINTCGANELFIFDSCINYDKDNVVVSNKYIKNEYILPSKFIYPLLTKENFINNNNNNPKKWILLPYHRNGKLLTEEELKSYVNLYNYFMMHKEKLISRKGVFIKSFYTKNNYWWALLGVGDYNFYPYKIVWESYGKKEFKPMLFEGDWQSNQSLHSYIPVKEKKDAIKILEFLNSNNVKKYIASYLSEGTMNFAQPGRIKKLFIIK